MFLLLEEFSYFPLSDNCLDLLIFGNAHIRDAIARQRLTQT